VPHVVVELRAGRLHVALGEQLGDGHRVVFGMEHLQTQLATEFVHGFGQLGERGDLLVAEQLRRGRHRVHGRHVADDDVGCAAFGDAAVEVEALRGD